MMTGYVVTAVADNPIPSLRREILTWVGEVGAVDEARFVEHESTLLLRIAFRTTAELPDVRQAFARSLAVRLPSWHVQARGRTRVLVWAGEGTDTLTELLRRSGTGELGARIVAVATSADSIAAKANHTPVPVAQIPDHQGWQLLDLADHHQVDIVVNTDGGDLDHQLCDELTALGIPVIALRRNGSAATVSYATNAAGGSVISDGPAADAATLLWTSLRDHCAGRVVITAQHTSERL